MTATAAIRLLSGWLSGWLSGCCQAGVRLVSGCCQAGTIRVSCQTVSCAVSTVSCCQTVKLSGDVDCSYR
eukprot:5832051-Prymnesium_polylepis.1